MTSTQLPTTAEILAGYQSERTYEEGATVRIYEQTASRDYDAKIVPGTYPIRYTSINYHNFKASEGEHGRRPYYGVIEVEIDEPTRSQSSAEFGGVALASETIQGKRRTHSIVLYSYMLTVD